MDRSQVVVITGAGGGLGVAVTEAFLAAGASVAVVSRSGPGLPAGEPTMLSVRADLSVSAEASRAINEAATKFGRIDALIHLAGGFEGGAPVAQTTDETWRRMLDINLNAAFFTCRAALPHLLRAPNGRIVAIGSRTGVEPAANLSAYGVSKAALISLIRTIALEVRGTQATANVVLPSVIDTPANRAAMPGADYSKWVQPASIARLLVWLASPDAADINRAVIPIYGKA